MLSFGSGTLIGTRSDIANSTPVNFGLVQEVTLSSSYSLKEAYGQYQYPIAVARGTAKVTGKAKVIRISGLAFANLFFGVVPTAGQTATSFGEAGTIPSVSTYVITCANSLTWTADQGVLYALTGLPLTRVASGPTVGQYSVAAGVYTFSAADEGKGVLLNYNYTISATGQQLAVNNALIGTTPTFGINFYSTFQGLPYNVQASNCVSSKLDFIGSKLEDYTMPEFDFSVFANAAGNVLNMSLAEAS